MLIVTILSAQESNNLQRLYNQALQFERMRVYDQASAQFEILFNANPRNIAYYQGLKRNLLRLEKYEQFLQKVKQRLSVQNDVMGNADLGSAYYKLGQSEDAMYQWDLTLQKYSGNASAYIQVANLMLQEGLVDQAVKTYKLGRKNLKDESLFAVELANIFASRDQRALATREYLNYYSKNQRQIRWVEGQILSYIKSDDSLAVLAEIRNFNKSSGDTDVSMLLLHANCLKSLNRSDEALQIIQQVERLSRDGIKNNREGQYFYQFAEEAYRQGKYDIALKAFTSLQQMGPENSFMAEAILKTAYIQTKMHNYQKALKSLDAYLLRYDDRFEAVFLKAKILSDYLHKPDEAIAVFDKLYKTSRTREQKRFAAIALGESHLQKGETNRAEKWYVQALQKTEPYQTDLQNEIYYKLAEVNFINKKFAQSHSELKKIKSGTSENAGSQDYFNDALEFLFLLEDNFSDSTTTLTLFADYKKYLVQNKTVDAEKALEKIISHYPEASLAPIALLQLANLYGIEGNASKREESLRHFIANYHDSQYMDEVLFQLAGLLAAAGKKEEAIAKLNTILVDHPYSTYLEETREKLRELSPSIQ